MIGLQYDPASYRTYVRFSHNLHLLVEGRDDKRIFDILLDELFSRSTQSIERADITIDSAEALVSFSNTRSDLGNRAKVESVSQSIAGTPYEDRFVGFVDREYREFKTGTVLEDPIAGHKVLARLVWTRGHSIENYFFDFASMYHPLRAFSTTGHYRDALYLLERVFEQVIFIACAMGLAARSTGRISLVKGSINSSIFDINMESDVTIFLDTRTWKNILLTRLNLDEGSASDIVNQFKRWTKIVRNSDHEIARWLAHGHIGFSVIWAAYSRCIVEVCMQEGYEQTEAVSESRKVLRADESVRFNACADRWVQRAIGDLCEYPRELLDLFHLKPAL